MKGHQEIEALDLESDLLRILSVQKKGKELLC
jgi:hypothetical protein